MTASLPTATSTRPEDARLPVAASVSFGLQHILSMFGGVIAVPIIVGGAAGLKPGDIALLISCALFISGLATLLQTLGLPRVGAQLPLVQGISFASVSTLVTVVSGKGEEGLRLGLGATFVASIVALAIVPFFALIVKFFPPVVTGSIITVIGLSLLPVAAGWITGQPQVKGVANPDYASAANVGLALATLAIVLVFTRFKRTNRSAILLGLALGTALAFATGQADMNVGGASIIAFPRPFAFGMSFDVAAIISMIVVMLVIMVETTADIIAVGEVVGADVDHQRVADGLRADMLSSIVSPAFNSFPATAFAQNVGLVAMSGIKSRFVVATGGVILAVLGLSPFLAAVVGAIPQPVLGGVGIALFGTVAASGIRTLAGVRYDGTSNLMIVAIALGFGLLPSVSPDFWSDFPSWMATVTHSGICACALVAVTLNLLFNINPRKGLDAAREAVHEDSHHHYHDGTHAHDTAKDMT